MIDVCRVLGLFLLCALLANPGQAQVNPDTPTPSSGTPAEPRRLGTTTADGDTGLWFVPTAEVLARGHWSVSAYRVGLNYRQGFTNVASFPFTVGFGLSRRVQLFAAFTPVVRIDRDLRPLFGPDPLVGGLVGRHPLVAEPWSGNQPGDVVAGAKVNLWSSAERPIGVAIRGLLKLPTASQASGAGTGATDVMTSIIVNNQRSAFAAETGQRELTWIHELRSVRNQWAHQEPFAPDDVYRALNTISRLLKLVAAPEATEVAVLEKTALERISGPSSPASVPPSTPPPRRVLRAPSTVPPPPGQRSGSPASSTAEELLAHFVSSFESGKPCLASYSWVYRRLFGYEPQPWSQGHGVKVITQSRSASPRHLSGLGDVRLDTFIVGADSRLPGPGYWPTAPCSEDEWARAFAHAAVLHGGAPAPWEASSPRPAGDTGRTVFVLCERGWVSHGPVRASEAQAHRVAEQLRKRLGWVVAVANHPPAVPSPLPNGLPTFELATLSPVWRDPQLDELWKAHEKHKK